MMLRIIILSSALLLSCSEKAMYDSKGYFQYHLNYPKDGKYFVTAGPNAKTDVLKLPHGDFNYYAWKTVKFNYKTGDESFSTYKTLTNDEYERLKPEELKYIRSQGKVLNNYLFFVDDYRFFYLSEDDKRSKNSLGDIFLYYDRGQYKLSDLGDSFDQLIRGYYTQSGNQLFFDFASYDHFYVMATLHTPKKIEFDSIYVPKESTIKRSGMNAQYHAFKDMLNSVALPIFEVPDTSGLVINNRFQLNFISLKKKIKETKRHDLHKNILLQSSGLGTQWKNPWRTQIIDIEYYFEPYYAERRYKYLLWSPKGPNHVDTLKFVEPLDSILTW